MIGSKVAVGLALAVFAAGAPAWAEDAENVLRSVVDVGHESYGLYCEVCHGEEGKGDGPAAPALAAPPADLTKIAQRRGGFSPASVAEFIDGRYAPRAHGPQHMPIWGRRFGRGAPAGRGGDNQVRAQVYALVAYLQTLQTEPPAPAADPPDAGGRVADVGWWLYIRNCAICHGYAGRGDGALAPLLATPTPDLTQIASRRRAEFPALEVAEWIDGRRGGGAHGTREMPIWGDQLGRNLPAAPGRQAAIRGEVQLLVAYLRSIQVEAARD